MHHSLILMDVKKKYSGTYTCIATNKAGQSICTATVEVADGKPSLQYTHILYFTFHTPPKEKKTRVTDREINQITTKKKWFPKISYEFACLVHTLYFYNVLDFWP